MSINFQELRELIAVIATTDITELNLKNTEFELNVRKAPGVVHQVVNVPAPVAVAAVPVTPAETVAPAVTAPDKKWVEIKSPMVGTFYRAPAPDEPAFVSVGDRITAKQTVCIIEAMKLMNELEAEVAGQVMEIVVENGQPVEFGQTLMYISPG